LAAVSPKDGGIDPVEHRPHLLAQAGEVVCALPLTAVRQVVKALPVHRLPGAAEELSGLAEYAGEPLPVLDLARLVGAAPGASPAYPVTVICWAGGDAREVVGLAADAALEVVPIDVAAVVSVEGGVAAGEARVGERVVRVLDLAVLGRGDGGGAGA
jgi:chemotaxis signal transduction protein